MHLELWNMKHGQAWKRMVDLFYIYKGNIVFSFTFTKGNIKDIHIHLHDLTLIQSYPPNIGLHLPLP